MLTPLPSTSLFLLKPEARCSRLWRPRPHIFSGSTSGPSRLLGRHFGPKRERFSRGYPAPPVTEGGHLGRHSEAHVRPFHFVPPGLAAIFP